MAEIGKNSNFMLAMLIVASLLGGPSVRAFGQSAAGPNAEAEKKMVLRVLGPDLRPVPGAKVGTGVNLFEDSQGHPPQTIKMWLRGRARGWPFISDAYGEIFLSGSDAEYEDFYALYEPRGWVGYLRMREAMAGGRADIHMEPACRLHGRISSSGLERLGLTPYKTTALLYDSQDTLLMYFVSDRGRYEFLVPSGRYTIEYVADGPGGVKSQRLRKDVMISRNQRDSEMPDVDLQETLLAGLLGKNAPELFSVRGWKRGEPVQLSDLKGQVVVLAFWASWSEASLKTMPRLIELYDQYQDQGLAIVAVHDNSVTNGKDLEKNLIDARLRYWGRRELPFSVALDAGPGRGRAHDAYGIEEWPTTIAIDKDGKVAGLFHPWGELQRELPKLMQEAGSPKTYSMNTGSTVSR